MTQKEKCEKLDKELRPKYEHLSDSEYQQVRAKYIKSRRRKLGLKRFFRGFVIPLGVGMVLPPLLLPFIGVDIWNPPSFVMLLWFIAITIWMGVELCRCNMDLAELPAMDTGLLTFEQVSRVIGGSKRWQSGKYRLVVRTAVAKEYIDGGVEDSPTTWLVFDNHGRKLMKHEVSSYVYADMKTFDRYYLVLKKNSTGEEKILRCYKEELTTLDDKLKSMLQK